MARFTRRNALKGGLAFAASVSPLAACGGVSGAPDARAGLTKVHVLGTIHGRHRTSAAYSLDVLRAAVIKAKPDVILTEIPPDRVAKALETYRNTGRVDEPRTNVFPEYTDVIIPLAQDKGWRIIGCAAWTPQIARNRRAALEAIQADPTRAAEWREHRAATREFAAKLRGRSDDPRFIHTINFDRLVANSREAYARHFDADLGPGGWTRINQGHNALLAKALDLLSGQGLSALITFGTAHKYKILESLGQREDIALQDSAALFR